MCIYSVSHVRKMNNNLISQNAEFYCEILIFIYEIKWIAERISVHKTEAYAYLYLAIKSSWTTIRYRYLIIRLTLSEYCTRIISNWYWDIRITRISLCCMLCFLILDDVASLSKIGVPAFPDYQRRRNYARDASLSFSFSLTYTHPHIHSARERVIWFHSYSTRYKETNSKRNYLK